MKAFIIFIKQKEEKSKGIKYESAKGNEQNFTEDQMVG